MKYFAQPTIQLSPIAEKPSRSALFSHKLKASARMIAGIRAQSSSHPKLRVQCPHASLVAGPHGELLADHLHSILPQLKDMVLTRTQHIDELIEQVAGVKQIVLAGAGLDMRSVRHAAEHNDIVFFELDLPEMINERQRVTKLLDRDYKEQRVLKAHPRFDATLPTIIVFEGCSMYFTEEENRRIFASFLEIMQHPLSCLWVDFVNTAVVTRRTNNQRIIGFLEGMDSLGESFVFGTDNPRLLLESIGFGRVDTVSSGEYLEDTDAVLSTYSASIARRFC